MRRTDAQHVAAAGAARRHLKLAHAVDSVGRHPGEGHMGGDGTPDHLHRQARLGGEGNLGWHVGCCQSPRVVRPGLGQIQGAVDEGMPVLRYVGGKHPDLAVGHLAGGPRVLPPHAA